jgi:hypothetical protein
MLADHLQSASRGCVRVKPLAAVIGPGQSPRFSSPRLHRIYTPQTHQRGEEVATILDSDQILTHADKRAQVEQRSL